MKTSLALLALAAAGVARATDARLPPSLRHHRHKAKAPVLQQLTASEPVVVEAAASPPEQTHAAAAAAPLARDSEGFPVLPEVSKVLGSAQQTLRGLAKQAAVLETRVNQAEKDRADKLSRQKAAFERKLKAQEVGNRALAAQNVQTSKEIAGLRSGNAAARQRAQGLNATNTDMRSEVSALQKRLGEVQDFVGQTLENADDSQDQDLSVISEQDAASAAPHDAQQPKQQQTLAPTAPPALRASSEVSAASPAPRALNAVPPQAVKNTTNHVAAAAAATDADGSDSEDVDEEDDEDDSGDDSAAPALISLRRVSHQEPRVESAEGEKGVPRAEAAARELIKELQAGVTTLTSQERAGELKLKGLFISSFHAGSHRRSVLVAEQQKLNATRVTLEALRDRLAAAEQHLQATQQQLQQRLQSLGARLQKLADLALAPAAEGKTAGAVGPAAKPAAKKVVEAAAAKAPVGVDVAKAPQLADAWVAAKSKIRNVHRRWDPLRRAKMGSTSSR